MNRHIFGFILFSLIVGVSAIIYNFFFAPLAAIQPVYVFENQTQPRNYFHSEKFKRPGKTNAEVVQAVFDQNTSQMDVDLFLDRKNNSMDEVAVRLDFFVKDGIKTRFLASEEILLPQFDFDNESTESVTLSYEWLNDLESVENLYVVPQTIRNADSYSETTPRFDKANAMPVTVVNKD